jgi:hypothetical protein
VVNIRSAAIEAYIQRKEIVRSLVLTYTLLGPWGEIIVKGVVDTGAKVNIMSLEVAQDLGLVTQEAEIGMRTATGHKFEFKEKADRVAINIRGIQNYTEFFLISGRRDQVLLGMPFISKTRLTLSHPTEDGHPLLAVFSREGERRALAPVSSYLLDAKEIEEKTVPPMMVLEPPSTSGN